MAWSIYESNAALAPGGSSGTCVGDADVRLVMEALCTPCNIFTRLLLEVLLLVLLLNEWWTNRDDGWIGGICKILFCCYMGNMVDVSGVDVLLFFTILLTVTLLIMSVAFVIFVASFIVVDNNDDDDGIVEGCVVAGILSNSGGGRCSSALLIRFTFLFAIYLLCADNKLLILLSSLLM